MDNTAESALTRPFADPVRFAAISERIDTEIEALSRDRRNLARVRRQVCFASTVYLVGVISVQGTLRATLAGQQVHKPLAAARAGAIAEQTALGRVASLTNRMFMFHLHLGLVGARTAEQARL